MEILVAVIAFAGAILAAIAAGALVRRLREEMEGWLIAWSVAAAALCLSLGVIAVGYLMGFGIVTFKLFQVTGSLLAPLWLGIGLMQLLSEKAPLKFLTWLFGIAITIVSTVIMAADPLIRSTWDKVLPVASVYWALIPSKLLIGVHAIAVLTMLAAIVIAGVRWRSGDEYDTDNLHATLVIAPSGIALVGAMRFSVPGIFTTALLVVAAAAVWYAVLRPLAPYEDDEEDDIQPEHPPMGRRPRQEPIAQAPPAAPAAFAQYAEELPTVAHPRRSPSPGLGDLVAEYRAGDQEVDYAARMMNGRHGAPSQDFGAQDFGAPATGAIYPGAELFTPAAQPPPAPQQQPQPQQQAASSRPSPSIFGLLTVFTLMDGSGEAFDRLADATVEAVRRGEPDTLVYACHAVKSAPLQRIVYELYRDEVAYHDHQRQPHVERFVNERQAMVLATNIIELNVNAAKVVPLPTAMF